MAKWWLRLLQKNEKGASLVEFALVVPVLLALVLGIIEFGWLFNGWITITGSAREGARSAAVVKDFVDENEEDGVPFYIRETVERHTSSFESVNIEIIPASEEVTVVVRGDIQPLVGFFVSGELVALSAEATMRQE